MINTLIAILWYQIDLQDVWATILTILSFLGAYLNLKKNKWGFILWVVADFFWGVYSLTIEQYGQTLVFFIYSFFAGWGYLEWHRLSKEVENSEKNN